jgi:ATP-dependent helicase HrpA
MITITYPPELPVSARREEIADAIRDHQVVIVSGETGSGKTTQLPKIALELGRERIAHTQPRRIAARAVAERIAEELGTELGDTVGYQVRFTDQSSARTQLKIMTDGILLATIQRDPLLKAYDTIIIDEAHERSLNIDFLLGYLTNLLPRRPDLKLIITSATIDSERFSEHFHGPVIEVTGRTYPVELRYRPQDGDVMAGIVSACEELMREGPGDILVFFSGEREIKDAADALAGSLPRGPGGAARVELLPLYSRLSAAEQHRVFQPHALRRIVLATNVAETSLTVPGIHYVVDPGTARISRYSKATKVQRLPIEPVSQASANQRAGRAGRLADGIAVRLYSEEDFAGRPEFTEPEILRTSLASVLLRMISVGVASSPDDVARFPFVEPPDTRAIRDGVNLLNELGALRTRDGKTSLTRVGRALAALPMAPRQARMVVEAGKLGVAREVAIIAAALSIQDPRERPVERRAEADLLHKRFADPHSDLLSYLNLWLYIAEQRKELSSSAFRRLCRAEFLNYLRIREWQDVVEQIRIAAKPLKIAMPRLGESFDQDAIHRSILAGLLSQLGAQDAGELKASSFAHLRGEARATAMRRARKQATSEYLGARGARFAINPGSALAKKPPGFIMAAELVETTRLWARDVAAVKPEWAEELAGDLAKRTYSEPHWSKKRGAAVATEKVLVYGVPIVADRTVLWGRINPADARDLFIRHALVEGDWETHHEFWASNQHALAEAEDLAARTRNPGALADDEALFDFYDDRIPASVVSTRHFDSWWKGARRQSPDLLTLTMADLLPGTHDVTGFPQTWVQGDVTLPLSYQFEPGSAGDGVVVHVPLALLPSLRLDGFDWLVPGLRLELVTATIRALPKPVRRLLVPAPDVARAIDAALTPNGESFHEAFTAAAHAVRGVEINAEAWDGVEDRLPSHLRMTFRVEDKGVEGGEGAGVEAGAVVGEGPDLAYLQRHLAPAAQHAVAAAVGASPGNASPAHTSPAHASSRPHTQAPPTHAPAGEPLTEWTRDLEDVVEGSGGVRGYPAIVDLEGTPTLTVLALPNPEAHARGVRRLLLTELALPVKRVTTRWTGAEALALGASPYPSTDAVVADLQLAAVTALTPEAAGIRDSGAYASARTRVREGLEEEVHRLALLAVTALSALRDLDAEIRAATSLALLSTVAEVRSQANSLVGDGFIAATPPPQLRHLPRYLAALSKRLEAASGNPSRDAALAWQVREVEDEWVAAGSPQAVRWMIEELRVSLFAQTLGTDGTVSAQRIRKALGAIHASAQR